MMTANENSLIGSAAKYIGIASIIINPRFSLMVQHGFSKVNIRLHLCIPCGEGGGLQYELPYSTSQETL